MNFARYGTFKLNTNANMLMFSRLFIWHVSRQDKFGLVISFASFLVTDQSFGQNKLAKEENETTVQKWKRLVLRVFDQLSGQSFIFMLRHFTENKTINLVLLVEKSSGSAKSRGIHGCLLQD